ncbi:MAG: hypothetical protein IMF19_13560 [Proteobacteria bacterium]|nr:hypothetical protein [Pseudomonadota bacterium]
MLKIAVSCRGPEEYEELEIDGQKLLSMRGEKEEKPIDLKELLESITEEVSGCITEPCDITIELSGSTTYGAGGGLKALIIDISGKAEKTSGIKITLNTKINPKK